MERLQELIEKIKVLESELVIEMQKESPGEVSEEDIMRMKICALAGLRRIENIYQQVEARVLDRQALNSVGLSFYMNPFVLETWTRHREYFDPGFVLYWDEVLSDDGLRRRHEDERK